MAILDTDLLLVNRPGDDATYKTTFATLKDNLPAGTIVSENPPGEDVVEQGLLWFDSSIASLFIWYDDGDTAQWVDVYAGAVSGLEIPPPVTVGANPPSGAVEGDLWWDTNKGELYVYYIDSDSEQWVAASPGGIYDGDGSGGGGATVIVGETAPTTRPDGTDLVEGDLWWNNDSTENGGGRMFVYYSNNWVDTSLPGGPGGGEGGSGDGASVSVGEVPPTGSSQGDLWWCSRSIDEGGGRLYIYYEGQWIDASIPGGGGGGGDFSQAEADTLYLSKVSDDTAEGAITFKNKTTHNVGVRISGASGNTNKALQISGAGLTLSSDTDYGVWINPTPSADHTGKYVGYHYRGSNILLTQTESIGFEVEGLMGDKAALNIGFKANINASTGNNYNFYAAGDAPNYFKGLTEHAGGVFLSSGTITANGNLSLRSGAPAESPSADTSGRLFVRTDNSLIIPKTGLIDSSVTITGTQTSSGTDTRPCGIRSEIITDDNFDGAGSDFICAYQSRVRASGTGNALDGKYIHYYAPGKRTSDPVITDELHGFRAGIQASDATNAYGFYSGGDAPNFWAGYNLYNGFSQDWSWLSTQTSGIRVGIRSNVPSNAQFEIATNRHAAGDGNIAILFAGEKTDSDTSKEIRGAIRINNTGVSYEETSDYRLKENVQPIANASELINQLNPSTYQFKSEPGVICHGFLAHELQTTLPRAVSGTKDATEAIGTLADYDGTVLESDVTEPSAEELEYTEEVETDGVATMVTRTRTWTPSGTRPVYQGVDQTKLIPLLTKALQEALDRIETLEADVATLQGN